MTSKPLSASGRLTTSIVHSPAPRWAARSFGRAVAVLHPSVPVIAWRLIRLQASKPQVVPLSVVLPDWLSTTPTVGLASRPSRSRGHNRDAADPPPQVADRQSWKHRCTVEGACGRSGFRRAALVQGIRAPVLSSNQGKCSLLKSFSYFGSGSERAQLALVCSVAGTAEREGHPSSPSQFRPSCRFTNWRMRTRARRWSVKPQTTNRFRAPR